MLPVRVEALLVKHSFFGPAARLCPIFHLPHPPLPRRACKGRLKCREKPIHETIVSAVMKAVSAAIRASAKRFFRRGESLQCIPSVLRWPLRLPSVAHRKMSGPYLSRRWYSPRMLLVDLLARASFSNALQSYEKILRLPWICSFLVAVWSHFSFKRQL